MITRRAVIALLLVAPPLSRADDAFVTEAHYTADQLARIQDGREAPDWPVSNFSYPEASVKLESLEGGGQALHIGRPDSTEQGRYTVGLRYPWTTDKGFRHEVTVRFAAQFGGPYNASASFVVLGPGGSGMINLANGFLRFDQPWGRTGSCPI